MDGAEASEAPQGRWLLGFAGLGSAGLGVLCMGPATGLVLSATAMHALGRDDRP